MEPTGGAAGRGEIDPEDLALIDSIGSHRELAEALGVDAERVRHWWARNNYGVKDLAIRADLRPPLYHVSTASRILRERIGE